MTKDDIQLVPALVEAGHVQDLADAGQTLGVSMSPLDDSFSIYLTPASIDKKSHIDAELPIYFARSHPPPTAEQRLFYADTYVIFMAVYNLLQDEQVTQSIAVDPAEKLAGSMRKLGIDYVNFIKECWIHASTSAADQEPQTEEDHFHSIYSCFSLFLVLYLPEPNYEKAPVGEELMEWLNIHFIEPSTEEGDLLSARGQPWVDANFWPYLTRSTIRGLTKSTVFFMNTLRQHPSKDLQNLVGSMIILIEGQPRLQQFTSERDFVQAFRRWRDRVKALRIEMGRVPEDSREDEYDNWWDRFSDILSILEGREDAIQRVCTELGSDWKEVCAAWGVFVDPRLRRSDLPDIVGKVLDDMPPDLTSAEDMVHSSLFSGQTEQALGHAAHLDLWLSAHFADMMNALGLVEDDQESELSLRDQYILKYTDYLRSDANLWRLTCSYMYTCGRVGQARADEVLTRLALHSHRTEMGQDATESTSKVGMMDTLSALSELCYEFKREEIRRSACRIAASALAFEREYGLAVSCYASAEDWPGIGRIADKILNEYIDNGPEVFANYAADIAPSLPDLRSYSGVQTVFLHRLSFAVQYSQFLQLLQHHQMKEAAIDLVALLNNDSAPKSWWANLLCDSVELLQLEQSFLFTSREALDLLKKLEEIFMRVSQGNAGDYITILVRKNRGGSQKDALNRLKVVRLALARYLARIAVSGKNQ